MEPLIAISSKHQLSDETLEHICFPSLQCACQLPFLQLWAFKSHAWYFHRRWKSFNPLYQACKNMWEFLACTAYFHSFLHYKGNLVILSQEVSTPWHWYSSCYKNWMQHFHMNGTVLVVRGSQDTNIGSTMCQCCIIWQLGGQASKLVGNSSKSCSIGEEAKMGQGTLC